MFLVVVPAARAADPIMPLSEVRQGMHCTGLSVIKGTTISSFDVEILDVIAPEAGLSGPRILIRVSGPAVDETGIGPGFSGSPVMCDGRNAGDPVPVSQSLIAFNLLAAPQDRLAEEEIAYFTREAQVPTALRSETTDPSYGGLRILFRRVSGNARVTVFDGGHDKNTEAGFRWLNLQRRSR